MSQSARQLFSQNVRKARLAKGLSQEDLAEFASLHRNYVGGVERGERSRLPLGSQILERRLPWD